MTSANPPTIIKAKYLFDGAEVEHSDGASVWFEGDRITGVYDAAMPEPPQGATVLDLGNACILPGLMDSHVHLMYGTADRMDHPKNYDHVNDEDSDSLMLLRTVRNGYRHMLRAGVTTMRDCGARRRVTFDLKEGISAGLFKGFPTVHACGRSITMTGGHFHFCEEEADGPEEVRKAVRRLIKEGADFIKVMGSGGGTYITDYRYASYTVRELAAIADECHRQGRTCTLHAIATDAVRNAVDAGFDSIEHFEFVEMDFTRRLDPAIGERIIENGMWLSPTIQTGYRKMEALLRLREKRPLTTAEQENLTYAQWKQEGQLYITGKLWEMGARKFVMGTDAISEFGDYAIGLELMAEAGIPNREVLKAATRNCAEDFGILDDYGTLETGKVADITVVNGNPIEDMTALRDVVQVVKGGHVMPMEALDLFPAGPGAAAPRRGLGKRRSDPEVLRLEQDLGRLE